MKCMSCKEDVPPKFVHAISVNICPLCGKEIMVKKLQEILNELKNVMEKSAEYKEETFDWLFSNYGLKKYDPSEINHNINLEPEQKTVKIVNPPKPLTVRRGEIEEDKATVFAKRAGIIKKVVEDIQAPVQSEIYEQDNDYDSQQSAPSAPLDASGRKALMGIFKEDDAQISELEKLKRLRTQRGGNFSRGE